MKEINAQIENQLSDENVVSQQFVASEETATSFESADSPKEDDYSPEQTDERKPKKTERVDAASSAGVLGVVAALFVVVVILAGGVGNVKAVLKNVEVFGTSFNFSLSVTLDYEVQESTSVDFENVDTGLRLVVANSEYTDFVKIVAGANYLKTFTEVEETAENTYFVTYTFEGVVDGLAEGTRYRISVVGDEDGKTVTYVKKDIKTTGGKVTKFNGVNYKCTCSVDGKLSFWFDYVDENGYYSNFTYTLVENVEGATPYKQDVPILYPNEKIQVSGVDELHGNCYKLIISFTSTAYTDLQNNAEGLVTIETIIYI